MNFPKCKTYPKNLHKTRSSYTLSQKKLKYNWLFVFHGFFEVKIRHAGVPHLMKDCSICNTDLYNSITFFETNSNDGFIFRLSQFYTMYISQAHSKRISRKISFYKLTIKQPDSSNHAAKNTSRTSRQNHGLLSPLQRIII